MDKKIDESPGQCLQQAGSKGNGSNSNAGTMETGQVGFFVRRRGIDAIEREIWAIQEALHIMHILYRRGKDLAFNHLQ